MGNNFDNLGAVLEGNADPDEVVTVLIRVFKMSKRLNIGLMQAIELYNEVMKDEQTK